MSALSSAIGTNSDGDSVPSFGCSQRTSASTPTISLDPSEMIGWNSTRSSSFSTADSSCVRRRSREYASHPIDVSNSAMRFLPCSLARYSAMSASRIRLVCA